jgi:mono/diheme cytochrome c family protein
VDAGLEMRELLLALKKSGSSRVRDVASFSLALKEPVKPGPAKAAQGRPLTLDEQAWFESGRSVYEAICIACHQGHGLGQEGLAPPLVQSEWVGASPDRLVRLVLHGMRGPVTRKGETYETDMPPLAVLDDKQIADVLTFIRREWGHAFEPVAHAEVKKIRDLTLDREDAWTEAELLKIP